MYVRALPTRACLFAVETFILCNVSSFCKFSFYELISCEADIRKDVPIEHPLYECENWTIGKADRRKVETSRCGATGIWDLGTKE